MTDFTIAIIADIHGNSWALEAVLQDIQQKNIQQIVNLGDSLQGPLDPAGTAERLIDLNILSICGNDDRVLFSPPENPSTTITRALEQLTPAHLAWLKSLPPTATINDDVFLCHGDPSSDLTYLLEEVTPNGVFLRSTEDITVAVTGVSEPIILCGHSHIGRAIFLPTGKFIVNPGSVGLPAYTEELPYPHKMESGSPHAKYAILSVAEDAWRVERVFVPYDWGKAASVAQSNQRPDWAAWLATGRA